MSLKLSHRLLAPPWRLGFEPRGSWLGRDGVWHDVGEAF